MSPCGPDTVPVTLAPSAFKVSTSEIDWPSGVDTSPFHFPLTSAAWSAAVSNAKQPIHKEVRINILFILLLLPISDVGLSVMISRPKRSTPNRGLVTILLYVSWIGTHRDRVAGSAEAGRVVRPPPRFPYQSQLRRQLLRAR